MPLMPFRSLANLAAGAALCLSAGLLSGCGGGGGYGEGHIDRPLVTGFSPWVSVIDFSTLQQNPTFTNGTLTATTDPNYPGTIVVFFNSEFKDGAQVDGTILDPASLFLGGDPNQGLDASALQVLQYIPGTGNVMLPLAKVDVQADRIICYPSALWTKDPNTGVVSAVVGGSLADGQYEIGVYQNIRNVRGQALLEGPVFHSFSVGTGDSVAPFVVTTDPTNNAEGVGAGVAAPEPDPGSVGSSLADVRTNIFGPTSPKIVVRFNEGIANASVTVNNVDVVDAGAFVPGGGAPPQIPPAPGFPKLKSAEDLSTLPSNGHELVWKADTLPGGLPFGTTVQMTVRGSDGGANGSPIRDLSGNQMETSYTFSFRTVQPPDFPQNPFPEYAVWWASGDRVGAIDEVNQQAMADAYTGAKTFPNGIPRNVIPEFTSSLTAEENLPGFDPTEISMDGRSNGATCHSWVYVISPSSGEVVVVNTRTSLPVAIIETPTPGGITNCTGQEVTGSPGQAANVVVVTNSSANTYTVFNVKNVTPGQNFFNGPVYIQKTVSTGNTPRAIAISAPADQNFHRDGYGTGPKPELIMYADFTDGVVNVTNLNSDGPVRSFNLGPQSAPNDVAMSPCFSAPAILFGAISQGGDGPGKGKVAYYIAGPGCQTGSSVPNRPDAIVGDLSDFDGPAGLTDAFAPANDPIFFVVAESGSQANAVTTLGFEVGANNFPTIIARYANIGNNPTSVCIADPFVQTPCIRLINDPSPACLPTHPFCWYNGTRHKIYHGSLAQFGLWWDDVSYQASQNMYVCARGSGKIVAMNIVNGFKDVYQPAPIPGVRYAATHMSQ